MRQIVVIIIFGLLLLLVSSFRYEIKSDTHKGERSVSYGVPGLYYVTNNDRATSGSPYDPYAGIPSQNTVNSYKFGVILVIVIIGSLLYM